MTVHDLSIATVSATILGVTIILVCTGMHLVTTSSWQVAQRPGAEA